MLSMFSKPVEGISNLRGGTESGDGAIKRRKAEKEATYLSIPSLIALALVVLSTLSTPVIRSMSLADIRPKGAKGGGVVQFGSWGWCVSGVKDVVDGCSERRAFGGPISSVLQDLPDGLLVLRSLDEMLPKAYTAASDVFSLIACLVAFWTLNTCLAASGAIQNQIPGQYQKAHKWTKMAYWFTFISLILTSIEFGLDIRKYVFIVNATIGVQAARPVVTIGPVIWLKTVALIMNLGYCLIRLISGARRRRSKSTSGSRMEAHSLSVRSSASAMPIIEAEGGLATWETLDLKGNTTEKNSLPRDSVQVYEVDSPDFTAPPRFPDGRGGAV